MYLVAFPIVTIHAQSGRFGGTQILGDWFTPIQKSGKGVYAFSIRLDPKGNFQLYRIQLHPDTNWEEGRYEGKWKERIDPDGQGSYLELVAEVCRIYTSRTLLQRRALLRGFDCDHLVMEARWEAPDPDSGEVRIVLEPDVYGDHRTVFFRPSPPSEANWHREKWAMVFSDGQENLAWGIDLKNHRKNSVGWLIPRTKQQDRNLSQVTVLEIVDSSLRFSVKPGSHPPRTGDFLRLP